MNLPHSFRPELLSPAGDWDALRAAVANGADAVYFGLSDFNARHRAANFTLEELTKVIEFLHGRNVRGYVTCNTLIFSDELPQIAEYIAAIARAGADAVIVQDVGLARLARRIAPSLSVHGSTQMTLTEARGVEFVRQLGVERVILARELAMTDVTKIAGATPMPLEVFVHGALCIAYSGQCLTSESFGGRSANRGQCAQACRLPYDLIVDGQHRDLGDQAYLLSPQDLAAPDLIDDLVKLGVSCFKIEGRLKSAHYVAVTTQTYRKALDAALKRQSFQMTQQEELDLAQSFSRGFTHGFLDGVNHQVLVHGRFPKSRGVRIGTVVARSERGIIVELDDRFDGAQQPGHSAPAKTSEEKQPKGWTPAVGVQDLSCASRELGDPREQRSDQPEGRTPTAPLKPGDGVVFDEGHPEQDEQGGRIFSLTSLSPKTTGVHHAFAHTKTSPGRSERGSSSRHEWERARNQVEITFGPGAVNLSAVSIGSTVWKTDDPALRRRLEHSYSRDLVTHRIPVSVTLRAIAGEPLHVSLSDDAGHTAEVLGEDPLQTAQNRPLTHELVRAQFGRLGDTPFELGAVEIRGAEGPISEDGSAPVMVPKSVLNELRRQAVALLLERRTIAVRNATIDPHALESLRAEIRCQPESPAEDQAAPDQAKLYVLARSLDQLRAVLDWKPSDGRFAPAMVYCDFEDVRRYEEAVKLCRQAHVPVGLATLRIIKPSEEGWMRQIADYGPDAVLVRNLAALSYYRERAPHVPLIGDSSLNVANELTAQLFAEQGLVRLVPSYDLNWQQLVAMLGRFPPRMFEAVVHQHMPMFHMEHCVFAATLSEGKDYRDCGRPCDHHRVELKDRVGEAHPLVADVGCRNTVFNASAQSAAEYIPQMQHAGLRHFRVELLREEPKAVAPLLERYARVLSGRDDGKTTWRQLRVLNQLGVTRGTLDFA